MPTRFCWCGRPRAEFDGKIAGRCLTHLHSPNPPAPKKRRVRPARKHPNVKRHPAWNGLSRAFLQRNPQCVGCRAQGRSPRPAIVTDHIFPVRLRPDLELHESNWQPLCESCHSRKGALERRKPPEFLDFRTGKLTVGVVNS